MDISQGNLEFNGWFGYIIIIQEEKNNNDALLSYSSLRSLISGVVYRAKYWSKSIQKLNSYPLQGPAGDLDDPCGEKYCFKVEKRLYFPT